MDAETRKFLVAILQLCLEHLFDLFLGAQLDRRLAAVHLVAADVYVRACLQQLLHLGRVPLARSHQQEQIDTVQPRIGVLVQSIVVPVRCQHSHVVKVVLDLRDSMRFVGELGGEATRWRVGQGFRAWRNASAPPVRRSRPESAPGSFAHYWTRS